MYGNNVTVDTRKKKIFTNLKNKGRWGIKSMNLTIKLEINNIKKKSIKSEGLNFESEPYHVIDGVFSNPELIDTAYTTCFSFYLIEN